MPVVKYISEIIMIKGIVIGNLRVHVHLSKC